jgi:capsular polysaccharide export protein
VSEGGLRFLCLEERRKRRDRLASVLSPVGTVRWRIAPFVSARGFPETRARAEEALSLGHNPRPGRFKRAVKLTLLGLYYNGSRHFFAGNPEEIAVTWNGQAGPRKAFMDGARDAGARRLFIELGVFPDTITVDPHGVNFFNGLPRRIEPYIAWARATGVRGAWRDLSGLIRQRPTAVPKLTQTGLPGLDTPFLFVPLQYPGDSQLRINGGAFRTVEAFVEALAEAAAALPEGWHVRVKEHPSAPTSLAPFFDRISKGRPLFLDNATDTFSQVKVSRGVVTVNSSVGLEAMLFEKPVVACGDCFWAIPGVAHSAPDRDALAAVMGNPEELGFDTDARDAFLDFLTLEYYPRLLAPDLTAPERTSEAAKILRRLSPEADDPIWGASC